MIGCHPEFDAKCLDNVMAMAAKLLVRRQHVKAASILANAGGRLDCVGGYDGEYDWRLRLELPADIYFDMADRDEIEKQICATLNSAIDAFSECDSFVVKLAPAPEDDPNWRAKISRMLTGMGITNQGRIRADNIAARQHEGLLFRSMPEIHFYGALKQTGIPFAPLSVVLQGGISYRRVEPDFVIFKDGLVMIVEIDGDLYHTETPAAAHARLKFIVDEGAKLERITANECDTPQKAREAVARVLRTIEKLRLAR